MILAKCRQVLSDERGRHLYDLSLDSRASRIAKEAAQGSETSMSVPDPLEGCPYLAGQAVFIALSARNTVWHALISAGDTRMKGSGCKGAGGERG